MISVWLDKARHWTERHRKRLLVVGAWSLWIGAALFIRVFLFQPFNIPSGSMIPTLLVGDHLFVSKYAYGYSRYAFPLQDGKVSGKIFSRLPARGDVIVFRPPSDTGQDYIKRIIGLPGDKIQMRNSRLYLNGDIVARKKINGRIYRETLPGGVSYLMQDLTPTSTGDNTHVYTVPQGHVFMMGDNRDNSTDSRFYSIGPIPLENLIGRASVIYLSWGQEGERLIRFNRLGKFIE